ncbi:MAG: hypothetical protein AAFX87_05730 [Bacteroidota bacterium]
MAIDIDVLISFADRDNEKLKEGEIGWVSHFKKFLEFLMVQILGEKPNILLKPDHDSLTGSNLDQVGVLISVLSPEMIQSGSCLDLIEDFYQASQKGKVINRLFKVLKSPIHIEDQPPRMKPLLGYELYQIDDATGEIKEFVEFFSPEAERNYWMKMVDLAYDIHEALLSLKEKTSEAEVKPLFSRKSIYLAETGHDLIVQRNIIRRELQRHGYNILPNQTLPTNVVDLEQRIEGDLEECSLSIHLIGSAYGEIPEGGSKSVVDIQNQMASNRSKVVNEKIRDQFSRLIWISPNLQNASEKQRTFVENIKRDMSALEGAEILQTPIEDFKNTIREELIEVGIDKKMGSSLQIDNDKPTVYLVHDRIDDSEASQIKHLIEKSGFNACIPAFEGDLLSMRQVHIDNLKKFDIAIIYFGRVNEQWVRMKMLDILKAPGFGRTKPILGQAIVVKEGNILVNKNYRNQDLTIIDGDDNKINDSVKQLLEELKP